MRGPDDSPYAGGEYHGVLQFTPNYPFAPPGIKMFTPSGRFQVSVIPGFLLHEEFPKSKLTSPPGFLFLYFPLFVYTARPKDLQFVLRFSSRIMEPSVVRQHDSHRSPFLHVKR